MRTPAAPIEPDDRAGAPDHAPDRPAPPARSITTPPDIRRESQHTAPFRVRSCRIANDVLSVEIIGALDACTAPLRDQPLALGLEPSEVPAHVEIDLQGLAFLDTCGLDVLSATVTGLEQAGAEVVVVGACHEVRKLLAFAAEHCWLTAGPILAAGASA